MPNPDFPFTLDLRRPHGPYSRSDALLPAVDAEMLSKLLAGYAAQGDRYDELLAAPGRAAAALGRVHAARSPSAASAR